MIGGGAFHDSHSAAFEGDCCMVSLRLALPRLQSASFGSESFRECAYVTFESASWNIGFTK